MASHDMAATLNCGSRDGAALLDRSRTSLRLPIGSPSFSLQEAVFGCGGARPGIHQGADVLVDLVLDIACQRTVMDGLRQPGVELRAFGVGLLVQRRASTAKPPGGFFDREDAKTISNGDGHVRKPVRWNWLRTLGPLKMDAYSSASYTFV